MAIEKVLTALSLASSSCPDTSLISSSKAWALANVVGPILSTRQHLGGSQANSGPAHSTTKAMNRRAQPRRMTSQKRLPSNA